MRQKELRIALICYGGVSLAVYMHGVTKELWKLTRASRAIHAETDCASGSETVYFELLQHLRERRQLILRVLPDILTGASAGGINAVFLAQAVHSGQSLEPLTELWLDHADVDRLLDPEAHKLTRMAKFWAPPVVELLFSRSGNAINESVAPETREQVRRKLGGFVKSRWFAPPFSVDGARLDVGISVGGALAEAGDASDPDALVLRADRAMYRSKAAAAAAREDLDRGDALG